MAGTQVYLVAEDAKPIEALRSTDLQVTAFPNVQGLVLAAHMARPACIVVQMQCVVGAFAGLQEVITGRNPIPSVVLLDHRHLDLRPRLRSSGFSASVTAPYAPAELINQIRRLTGGVSRTGTRLSAAIPVSITAGSHTIRGVTVDVSPGGLGMLVDRTLPLGTPVDVSFGGGHTLRLSGTLVSHRPAGSRWQVGIRLQALSDDERTRLRELVLSHPFSAKQLRFVGPENPNDAVFTDDPTLLVDLPELV